MTRKNSDDILGAIFGLVLGFVFILPLLTIYSVLTYGFVLSNMWEWFMVPLGLPTITLVHAYGLALIVALTSHQHNLYKNKDNELAGEKVFHVFLSPWMTLLVGYILHTIFMGA